MGNENRRYRMNGGKLEKSWDGDKDGWFKTKAEALEAVAPKPEPEPVKQPAKRGPKRKAKPE